MANGIVRSGLYRDTIAGMVWVLFRLRGCMGVRELGEELKAMGVDVSSSKVRSALHEYTGRLFTKAKNDGHTVYCAIERV